MSGHTPGPWSGCKNCECQCGYIFGAGGEVYVAQAIGEKNVDEMGCPDPHPRLEMQKANCRLIVAAPDQNNVLREMDNYLSSNPKNYIGSGSQFHREIKAALARAEPHKADDHG